jgi:enoyl-CoA hydratase
VLLSEVYTPRTALEAGFLDGVAPGEELRTAAAEAAARMATLDRAAHKASKLRARSATLDTIAAGIDAEFPPHVH